MKRIGILQGPNLNLLGKRRPELYGTLSLSELHQVIEQKFSAIHFTFFQTNHEGIMIDKLQEWNETQEAVVCNPAAYTHSSIALADTIEAIDIPVVEVHLSDVLGREHFRKISYLRPYCHASFHGNGVASYIEAIHFLLKR